MQYILKNAKVENRKITLSNSLLDFARKSKIKFLVFLMFISTISSGQLRGPFKQQLTDGWQFREAGTDKWLSAKVPGCVHTDLMESGIIDDVFYRDNEKKSQWIETKDWEYQNTFYADRKIGQNENVDLILEGLDTYADVYLNDNKVLEAGNMFVGYTVPVKDFLRTGINTLRIYFHSPIKFVLPKYDASTVKYPSDNDASDKKVSAYTRKAAYQYGWDFAPRTVTSGIWRPVTLEAWSGAKITDVYLKPLKITSKRARYEAEINFDASYMGLLQVIIKDYKNDEIDVKKLMVQSNMRNTKIKIPFTIKNPELWMPNRAGKQKLYNIDFEVIADNNVYRLTREIGVRSIEVINEVDKDGKSFYVKVNDKPLYMRGANVVPLDMFPSRVTKQQYAKLFADLKTSNVNMLRVWGGGVYEDDEFYRLADENGILIWQDFMFSGTMYPVDSAFIEQVNAESTYNIKRLRNHASLAMWCGNNEIQVAWDNWGWQETYKINAAEAKKMYSGYKKLFADVLPNAVNNLDSGRFYFPSSPQSNWGKLSELKSGDNHYWGVWHGEEPVESFQNHIPRFASEFGLPSLPELSSVMRFTVDSDLHINSDIIKGRMKSYKGLGLLQKYVDDNYPHANDLSTFIYNTNVLQADAVTSAIEAQRRSKPYCMGSLYWQLNECWPGISWSSIDYYGKWKALQYQLKDAYADVMLSLQNDSNKSKLWVVNDVDDDYSASLDLHLLNFEGKLLWKGIYHLKVNAGKSYPVNIDSVLQVVKANGKNDVVLNCIMYGNEGVIVQKHLFFDKTKNLDLPSPEIDYDICQNGDAYLITLYSKTLAKNVYLSVANSEATFSDNYFDMLPGDVRQVEVKSILTANEVMSNLKILTMKGYAADTH